jgi:hypothetical protein
MRHDSVWVSGGTTPPHAPLAGAPSSRGKGGWVSLRNVLEKLSRVITMLRAGNRTHDVLNAKQVCREAGTVVGLSAEWLGIQAGIAVLCRRGEEALHTEFSRELALLPDGAVGRLSLWPSVRPQPLHCMILIILLLIIVTLSVAQLVQRWMFGRIVNNELHVMWKEILKTEGQAVPVLN